MFMKKLFSDSGVWRSSEYSDLPEVWVEAPETVAHFLVIAGGLSLLLSRASENEVNRRLGSTRYLHQLLRAELRQHGRSSASAELINNVLHECGHLVDVATKNSLKACLEARSAFDAAKRNGSGSRPAALQPKINRLAPPAADVDSGYSQMDGRSEKRATAFSWLGVLKLRGQKGQARPGSS